MTVASWLSDSVVFTDFANFKIGIVVSKKNKFSFGRTSYKITQIILRSSFLCGILSNSY